MAPWRFALLALFVTAPLLACSSEPDGTAASSNESALQTTAPAVWASCSIGATIGCALGVPADYPLKPTAMRVTVTSALGQSAFMDEFASDLGTIAVRPEGFPYTVRFELGFRGIADEESFTITKQLAAPTDAPIEARTPFPLWHVRIDNPEGLDFSFVPRGRIDARTLDGYTAGGAASVSFAIPGFDDAQLERVFIAPTRDKIDGQLTFPGASFTDPEVTLATSLDGPGVYEVRSDGLHLVSR